MTGAVAFLSGLEGLAIVIHGSSGCFYYPASLVGGDLHGTLLLGEEVVFGGTDRLCEVVAPLSATHRAVAVVQTCAPAVSGEDPAMLQGDDIIMVDSPGFTGGFDAGFRKAQETLRPLFDRVCPGVTIDGLNPADPFYRGNFLEARRILECADIPFCSAISSGRFEASMPAGEWSVTVNPDLVSGIGQPCGSFLGFPAIRETMRILCEHYSPADPAPVLDEVETATGRIAAACDKYLRRYDPPVAAVFGTAGYAAFASSMLSTFLDADITFIGLREDPVSPFPGHARTLTDLEEISQVLGEISPDLVLGSSYERAAAPGSAFVGLTFPQRGRVMIGSRALAGTEGALRFMDEVLNACMDRCRKNTGFP
jgi:nitrogenase molybdenum-iron protein alpha/beta subunit